MQNFFSFFIRFRVFLMFFVFEVFALVLVFRGSDYHKAAFINSANSFTGGMYEAAGSVTQYFHLLEVNNALMDENARLQSLQSGDVFPIHKSDTVDVHDTAEKYSARFSYIAADVIGNTTAQRNNYLMLNAGTADGITKGCGVISEKGVVGIVLDVSTHYCSVISVLNSYSQISTKVDSTNNTGTLTWNGKDSRYGQINDLNKHVKVTEGFTLSTSGYGSIFPRNIPVGTVKEFHVEGNFNFIEVNLATNFESVRYAYIVKNLDQQEQENLLKVIKEK